MEKAISEVKDKKVSSIITSFQPRSILSTGSSALLDFWLNLFLTLEIFPLPVYCLSFPAINLSVFAEDDKEMLLKMFKWLMLQSIERETVMSISLSLQNL
eukprot:100296-Amorphochlora_amoeboformis.AAC.1